MFRLGMHGRDPRRASSVIDRCPLFEKKYPKLVKAVAGALAYLGNSRDLGLGARGHPRQPPHRQHRGRALDPHGRASRARRWPACSPTPYPTAPASSA